MSFAVAQKIADAVLYEGYLLYPYRASSDKNRVRFQFGVVAPQDHSLADGSETWEMQTEVLLEAGQAAAIDVRVRFLQLQARDVERADPDAPTGFAPTPSLTVGGEDLLSWEEATEAQVDVEGVSIAELLAGAREVPFRIAGDEQIEPVTDSEGRPAGRIVRTRWQIDGRLVLTCEPVDGYVRLGVRVENLTTSPVGTMRREEALRRSLLGCHTLLAVRDGAFVSMIDPPADAAAAVKASTNLKTWPVLVGTDGDRDLVLSSPIILYDYPAIAEESQGSLFDSTEIDEILTLRIMTLTDEEKKVARATDPRARAIIDAADDMPPEILDRLHGAIRYLRETPNREVGATTAHRGSEPGFGAAGPGGAQDDDPAAAIQPWTPDLSEPDWPTFTSESLGLPASGPSDLPPSVWEPDARIPPNQAAIEIAGVAVSRGASVRLRPNRRADSMDFFLAGKTATVELVYESVDDDMHVAVTLDDDPAQDINRVSGRYYYFAPDELEPLAPAPADTQPPPIMLERTARSEAR